MKEKEQTKTFIYVDIYYVPLNPFWAGIYFRRLK